MTRNCEHVKSAPTMTFTRISKQNIIEISDAGHKDVDQCISIRFICVRNRLHAKLKQTYHSNSNGSQDNNAFSVFLFFPRFRPGNPSCRQGAFFSEPNERKAERGACGGAVCSSPDDQDVQQKARKENNQRIKGPVCY